MRRLKQNKDTGCWNSHWLTDNSNKEILLLPLLTLHLSSDVCILPTFSQDGMPGSLSLYIYLCVCTKDELDQAVFVEVFDDENKITVIVTWDLITCESFVVCRMWEFSVGLYMITLWPDSLMLAAIYGAIESASTAFFGPIVGQWVERSTYVKVWSRSAGSR